MTTPAPPDRFHVTLTFTPTGDGPVVEGTWDDEKAAVKRFRGFIGTHGNSDHVTVTLWAETGGVRRRLRTWTRDAGEVLHDEP
ncbi:hypothetical protein [Streptomyces sp. NBC_01565]|uniref:hypothetical protein n=1 Tax=Streptomyces sp. NBC_01565 TaxID=2975881 RepID=UPI002254685F|nr:hypothetical protein [Streptomyces sp. NBC_01565]MCX4546647.1 hypothetical protein [Streptomyces sp. NBC_01565]